LTTPETTDVPATYAASSYYKRHELLESLASWPCHANCVTRRLARSHYSFLSILRPRGTGVRYLLAGTHSEDGAKTPRDGYVIPLSSLEIYSRIHWTCLGFSGSRRNRDVSVTVTDLKSLNLQEKVKANIWQSVIQFSTCQFSFTFWLYILNKQLFLYY